MVTGVDAIYATNTNRKFTSSNNIRTYFVRKARAGKYEYHRKQLAAQVKKSGQPNLEGSFEKDKQHYYLNRIKVRTKEGEYKKVLFKYPKSLLAKNQTRDWCVQC